MLNAPVPVVPICRMSLLALPPLMVAMFGVVVSIMTVSPLVGVASVLQLPAVNQLVEAVPVHVSIALAEDTGNPAKAVPASSSAASLAERYDFTRRNPGDETIMIGNLRENVGEVRVEFVLRAMQGSSGAQITR